jgi:sugar lactone lactonase YvrE
MQIKLSDIQRIGSDFVRPECVHTNAAGDIFTSHHGGGVSHIDPSGARHDYLGPGDPVVATNGFSITAEGDFLCASLLPPGGVWRITRASEQIPVLLEIDGVPLVSVNFVHVDAENRAWATISTRENPRQLGYRPDVASGFIILIDPRGARVVAQDLGYTNEAKVDPSGRWLYVNETFARRTSRYAIAADGGLGTRETVTEYGEWVWPDGLDFDAQGGVWISSVVSNRVIRVAADGTQEVFLEEVDVEHCKRAETAYQACTMDADHLGKIETPTLRNVSSITFGGADLKTAYLGNLLDDCIYTFRSPIAGAPPPHWNMTF